MTNPMAFGVEVTCLELGHVFKLTHFLTFLINTAHQYFPEEGLGQLLEKLEFSKGTEWVRTQGLRVSFINHYEVNGGLRQESDNPPRHQILNPMNSRDFALKLNKYLAALEKIF